MPSERGRRGEDAVTEAIVRAERTMSCCFLVFNTREVSRLTMFPSWVPKIFEGPSQRPLGSNVLGSQQDQRREKQRTILSPATSAALAASPFLYTFPRDDVNLVYFSF